MAEQRLKVESGPPQHMIDDADQDDGQDLAGKAQEAVAPASEKVKGVASQLEQADGASLASAAADLARENPAAAAAAGAAAGFVAGRVIKAATGDGPAEEPETPAPQADGGA